MHHEGVLVRLVVLSAKPSFLSLLINKETGCFGRTRLAAIAGAGRVPCQFPSMFSLRNRTTGAKVLANLNRPPSTDSNLIGPFSLLLYRQGTLSLRWRRFIRVFNILTDFSSRNDFWVIFYPNSSNFRYSGVHNLLVGSHIPANCHSSYRQCQRNVFCQNFVLFTGVALL